MSLMSNRRALAPIKDSHLNINSPRVSPRKNIPLTPNYKNKSPIKSNSTSDLRTAVSSPLGIKNDTAGLAATKLKLKLQLALYKLQQQRKREPEAKSPKSVTPPGLRSLSVRSSQLPTPPKANYMSSINVNLITKAHLLNSKSNKPSLSKIASNKQCTNNKITKLNLFRIKKNSVFYNSYKDTISSYSHKKHSLINQKKDLGPSNKLEIKLPRPIINSSFTRSTNLPSINKILKTPIKNSNSTRNLIPNNPDDTIDEDDVTITNNNATSKKNNILLTSPINNFGTPNSFSVAKSLLQLGGYSMS